MTIAALIVAAGRGLRAGGELPKQWRHLAGANAVQHTLRAFQAIDRISNTVIVLHPDDMDRREEFERQGLFVAVGGKDRAGSVRNGLAVLRDSGCTQVLIHDVARPCVPQSVIDRVITALETSEGAAPALAVTDALWTGVDGIVSGTKDRTGLYRAQTPQGFDYAAICAAHAAHPGVAPDDVEVARAAGMQVAIVPGDEDNLKITFPGDFARAERILREPNGH